MGGRAVSGQGVAWVDLTVPNAAAVRDFYAGIEHGGEVLRGPSPPNDAGRTCFVRDPAGAVVAFFEPGASALGT